MTSDFIIGISSLMCNPGVYYVFLTKPYLIVLHTRDVFVQDPVVDVCERSLTSFMSVSFIRVSSCPSTVTLDRCGNVCKTTYGRYLCSCVMMSVLPLCKYM